MTAAVITRTYKPRGACLELFQRRDPEVLLSGPAGTGKSRACLEKLHHMALINPGMRALIIRKTAVSLTSTALVTYREHVANEALDAGLVAWYGGSGQEPAQYRYSNGSVVIVGGMDKATKIMSSEYDLIYVQEAIELTENDWEALTTRLRNGRVSFQQLIADTNPDKPTHWLKVRADAGRTTMLESRHADNPALVGDDGTPTPVGADYLQRLANLTGVRRQRLQAGLWVAAEGMIYEGFDPAVHVLDRFVPPKDWPRWWSVDFGYTNPFVLQRWAVDPDGRLYLYAEQYATKKLVEDHAREALALIDGDPRPAGIICDHDAEDRATLEKHLGMSTTAAKKTVSDGIQAVQSRLKIAGDGKPRLYIVRNAVRHRDQALLDAKRPTCTLDEIAGYVWETGDKDRPVKQDDHGMDGMRYMVAERDLGTSPGLRWLN